uniref:Uncharacterized protein n=1 Tax=Arundo donax TaxID=35708 RepID=A0A0A9SVU3_ARUDO
MTCLILVGSKLEINLKYNWNCPAQTRTFFSPFGL